MSLSTISDQELCTLVKEKNSNEAMKELISRHSGGYINEICKFKNNPLVEYDDLVDNKDFLIYKTSADFDPSRGKFVTLLSLKSRQYALKLIEKAKKRLNINQKITDEQAYYLAPSGEDIYKKIENDDLINRISEVVQHDTISEFGRYVFTQRYLTGDSKLTKWNDIAESLNVSSQNCQQRNKLTISKIRDIIKV